MKKAIDPFKDSSRVQHDLQGDETENQRRTKSDSKQQPTKNQMTKRPRAYEFSLKKKRRGLESACNAGDQSSIPGLGRYPGKGNGWLLTPVFLP